MTAAHPFSTRKGRRLREAKLRSVDWLCEPCRHQGCLAEAVEVHHIRPLRDGGDPFPPLDGLEALCGNCHLRQHGGRPKVSVDARTGLPIGDHWWNAK